MNDRITIDPAICHGSPTIKGTRMRVVDVIEMLDAGFTGEQIVALFPLLSLADIHACQQHRHELAS